MRGGPIPFGKYLLVDRINVGGMAEVFLGKAFGVEGFERVLAIKRILPNMADDDEFIAMFVDEARIAVQLSHASIVQIYELGKLDRQYYIAMEYVSGRDLRHILDKYRKAGKTIPAPAGAFIASKICEGLDYAHRKADASGRPLNVVHRDVSPQNILVSFEGAVKITDFGIAKAEDRASKTQAGVLKGKFGYMSPEQVRGLPVDHRSDVFAVGILLYEMLTGERLFVGESDFATLEKVRKAEIVPPRQVNPDLPEALETVMMKALARERDERYAWASDLHEDLQQFLIEENSIYNAKRVAALLATELEADIERERVRMEEFARVQWPAAAARVELPEPARARVDIRGEKTMVFESALESTADGTAEMGFAQVKRPARPVAESAPRATASAAKGRAGGPPGPASVARRAAPSARSRTGVALVGVSIALAAAVVLGVLLQEPAALEPSLGTPTAAQSPGAPRAAAAARQPGVPSRGKLIVRSTPAGATVLSGPNRLGVTPLELPDLDTANVYGIKLVKDGYRDLETTVAFLGRPEALVSAELERDRRPAAAPRKVAGAGGNGAAADSGCRGSGAKLSVNAQGVGDCTVVVGHVTLGVAPFFAKDAPTGKCEIVVSCPGGRTYSETRVLGGGAAEKLIIEPSMWK